MARKLNKAVAVYLSLLYQASEADSISRNIAQKACHGIAGVMMSSDLGEDASSQIQKQLIPIRQLILNDLFKMEASS